MANLSRALKCLCTTLFFLFLVSYSASSSSPSYSSSSTNQEIQPQKPSSTTTPAPYYQVFYLKNTNPMFLTRQEFIKKRKINRTNMKQRKKNMKQRKKKMVKNFRSRPFSVMLPKGFVPPSGSSPCHNDQPNTFSFHCHLSAAEEP